MNNRRVRGGREGDRRGRRRERLAFERRARSSPSPTRAADLARIALVFEAQPKRSRGRAPWRAADESSRSSSMPGRTPSSCAGPQRARARHAPRRGARQEEHRGGDPSHDRQSAAIPDRWGAALRPDSGTERRLRLQAPQPPNLAEGAAARPSRPLQCRCSQARLVSSLARVLHARRLKSPSVGGDRRPRGVRPPAGEAGRDLVPDGRGGPGSDRSAERGWWGEVILAAGDYELETGCVTRARDLCIAGSGATDPAALCPGRGSPDADRGRRIWSKTLRVADAGSMREGRGTSSTRRT